MQDWSQGVELELHGVGSYRTVRSTEDAAYALLAHWPRGKGKAYLAAQQACLDALEGVASPEQARAAFIRAARAARIHIRTLGNPRTMAMTRSPSGNAKVETTDADNRAWREANTAAMAKVKRAVARATEKSREAPDDIEDRQ